MKKRIIIIIVTAVLLVAIAAVLIFSVNPSAEKKFADDFGITLPKNTTVIFEESDTDFDGDEFFAVFGFDSNDVNAIAEQVKQNEWTSLPINESYADDLKKNIEAFSKKDADKLMNLYGDVGYFIIRQNSALKNPAEYDQTSNIKVAIFDLDKKQMYYFKWTSANSEEE